MSDVTWRDYCELGIPVFPLKPGSKQPATEHGWKDARCDWESWPEGCGVGVATGPAGLFVVDVDRKAGFSSPEDARAMLALPDTYTVRTPSGGWHFYYSGSGPSTASRLAPGVDTRGVGGYVVAPPTPGYEVIDDRMPAEAPQWPSNANSAIDGTGVPLDRRSVLEGVPEGQRQDTLFRYASSLRGRGIDYLEAEVLMLHAASACEPSFPSGEALAILERVWNTYAAPLVVETDPRWTDFTLEELLDANLPPLRWTVADLIPEGLTILAGPPKLGKSWFTLDMAISCSTGRPFLGAPVSQGDVLLFALEDNARRLQGRTRAVLGYSERPQPGSFRIRTAAPPLGGGLEGEIQAWATSALNPRLVIVDTLGRVMPRGDGPAGYDQAIGTLGNLQAVAAAYGLAIVVVTHTRKVSDAHGADPLEAVMGSQGFAGTADTIMVFRRKRGSDEASVFITGREVKNEQTRAIRWEGSTCRWEPGAAS